MTILGIKNRSENWKTARCFSPLFGGRSVRLAERLGEPPSPQSGQVKLELFWKGMRDLLNQTGRKKGAAKPHLVAIYAHLFPTLRKDIEKFGEFRDLKICNYDVSTDDRMANFVDNLTNTEIDVVLETPNHLFIGEAKNEMSFGANGNLVLVHQLIRQYVMAKILIEFSDNQKAVIPFVVCNKVATMKKTSQVGFMISQGWLREKNVLGWDEINPTIPRL